MDLNKVLHRIILSCGLLIIIAWLLSEVTQKGSIDVAFAVIGLLALIYSEIMEINQKLEKYSWKHAQIVEKKE